MRHVFPFFCFLFFFTSTFGDTLERTNNMHGGGGGGGLDRGGKWNVTAIGGR